MLMRFFVLSTNKVMRSNWIPINAPFQMAPRNVDEINIAEPAPSFQNTDNKDSKDESSKAQSLNSFQYKAQFLWNKWKKPLMFIGGTLGFGTLGTMLVLTTKHYIHENASVSPFKNHNEEVSKLMGRFMTFEDDLKRTIATKQLSQAEKIRHGHSAIFLFNQALKIKEFPNLEISPENVEKLSNTVLKTVLQYAMGYEEDVLPTLISQLHQKELLPPLLNSIEGFTPIKTAYSDYIERHYSTFAQVNENQHKPIKQLQWKTFQNNRAAIDLYGQFNALDQAKSAVLRQIPFPPADVYESPMTNFEAACVLDHYGTYLKRFDPTAYSELLALQNKILPHPPEAEASLSAQDLIQMAKTLNIHFEIEPWQHIDEKLSFRTALEDLVAKRLKYQEIHPNYIHQVGSGRSLEASIDFLKGLEKQVHHPDPSMTMPNESPHLLYCRMYDLKQGLQNHQVEIKSESIQNFINQAYQTSKTLSGSAPLYAKLEQQLKPYAVAKDSPDSQRIWQRKDLQQILDTMLPQILSSMK